MESEIETDSEGAFVISSTARVFLIMTDYELVTHKQTSIVVN